MLVPVLVTPPVGQVVSLEELRAQCRLGPNSLEFDDQLMALGRAAVSHLDGHHGILGRCILEQQWAVTLTRPGSYGIKCSPHVAMGMVMLIEVGEAEAPVLPDDLPARARERFQAILAGD